MSVSHQFLLKRRDDPHARAALLKMLRPAVRGIASEFFAPGLEHEDLVAVGLAAADEAIDGYDGRGEFRPFAHLCIRRKIISTVIWARRGKHSTLNGAASLNAPLPQAQDPTITYADVLPGDNGDFAERLHTRDALLATLAALSPFEQRVVFGRLHGLSYEELAAELGRTEKAIDNGLQRSRKKLERALAA